MKRAPGGQGEPARRDQSERTDFEALLSFPFGAGFQWFSNILPTQFKANGSLNLAHDLVVGDGSSRLVVSDNLRLFIDFGGQILLGHALALPALLDHFAHLQGNSVMVQLFCLPVELGCVLCNEVLFVLACCPYHPKQEQTKPKQTKDKQNKAQAVSNSIKVLLSAQLLNIPGSFQDFNVPTSARIPARSCPSKNPLS